MINSTNKRILEIFRAYDVRGLFPDQLNEEIAFNIGKGFADTIGAGSSVAVARDVRSSSLAIHEALCKGITSKGIDVIDLGEVPSPLLYFNTRDLRLAGGAMITASHLPPNWNGIKFCDSRGIVVSDGTGLESIKQAMLSEEKNTVRSGIVRINGTTFAVSYASRMVEVSCPDSAKFFVVSKVTSRVKKIGYHIEEIDGVKIHSMNDDSEWVLIRASNTSPIIRINAEGKSKESTEKLLSFGVNMVKEAISND